MCCSAAGGGRGPVGGGRCIGGGVSVGGSVGGGAGNQAFESSARCLHS